MNKQDALDYFDGSVPDVAKALQISPAAIYQWGSVVPYHSATELHDFSSGKIPLLKEHYGPGGRILSGASAA